MFTSDIKEKLIKELNMQLENGSFYTMNDISNFTEHKDDVDKFESLTQEKALSFTGLAKITGADIDTSAILPRMNITNKGFSNYLGTIKNDSSKLYRPLVNNFDNPFGKRPYIYKTTFDVAVNGMAFLSQNGGIVENPLSKKINIVNNSITPIVENSRHIIDSNINTYDNMVLKKTSNDTLEEKENKTIDGYKIEPIAINTYNMLDILNEAGASDELIFDAIPKEYALTTVSKWNWRKLFFKEINILNSIKKLFLKSKVK